MQAAEDVLDNLDPTALVEIKASGEQGGTLEDSELFKRVHSQVSKVGEMGLGNMMGNAFGGNNGGGRRLALTWTPASTPGTPWCDDVANTHKIYTHPCSRAVHGI